MNLSLTDDGVGDSGAGGIAESATTVGWLEAESWEGGGYRRLAIGTAARDLHIAQWTQIEHIGSSNRLSSN